MKNSKIIEKNKNAIILLKLQIPEENKLSIRGTGFIISKDGKFITNYHVYKSIPEDLKKYLKLSLIDKTDEKGITHFKDYMVELLKSDKENDIALMKIITEENKIFSAIGGLGDAESVKEGEDALFMGYPLATELISMGFGITMSSKQCIISSIKNRGTDGSLHFFMVDTHINNGSSGSPVFSIKTGKIIGVASGKISTKITDPKGKVFDIPADMGICVPSKYIEKLSNNNQ